MAVAMLVSPRGDARKEPARRVRQAREARVMRGDGQPAELPAAPAG